MATNDASGLIDIRALAGILRAEREVAPELVSLAPPALSAPALFAPVAIAPIVIEPRGGRPQRRGVVAGGAILGGSMLTAACAIAIAVATTGARPASAAPPVARSIVVHEVVPEATIVGTITTVAPIELGSPEPIPETAPIETAPDAIATTEREPTRPRRRGRAAPTTAAIETTAIETAATAPEHRTDSAIDRLLRDAVAPTDARSERTTRTDTLPATPDRADVARAMGSVRAAVSACGRGQHGTLRVSVVVAGATGRVTSASVDGDLAGTPVASCAATALRAATVSPFARPSFTIHYPFRI